MKLRIFTVLFLMSMVAISCDDAKKQATDIDGVSDVSDSADSGNSGNTVNECIYDASHPDPCDNLDNTESFRVITVVFTGRVVQRTKWNGRRRKSIVKIMVVVFRRFLNCKH